MLVQRQATLQGRIAEALEEIAGAIAIRIWELLGQTGGIAGLQIEGESLVLGEPTACIENGFMNSSWDNMHSQAIAYFLVVGLTLIFSASLPDSNLLAMVTL